MGSGTGRKTRGYTLVELMIVVSLVSIIAGTTVPVLTKMGRQQALAAEAGIISSFIYNSRRVAKALKRCVNLRAGSDPWFVAPAWYVDGTATDGLSSLEEVRPDCETDFFVNNWWSWRATRFANYKAPLGMVVELRQDSAAGYPVVWRPTGVARGNGDLTLSDNGFSVRIRLIDGGDFVMIKVSPFGQICSGRIGESNPVC